MGVYMGYIDEKTTPLKTCDTIKYHNFPQS